MNAKKLETKIEPLVPEKEILEVINFSQSWVSRNRDKAKLPYHYIGGHYKYLLSEVDQWRRQRRKRHQ